MNKDVEIGVLVAVTLVLLLVELRMEQRIVSNDRL